MGNPIKGKADFLALGDWNAVCYECGRKFKASELKRHWQGYWVCPQHWEPRQPQDFVRGVPDVQTPPWVQPSDGEGTNGVTMVQVEDDEDLITITNDDTDGTIIVENGGTVDYGCSATIVITVEDGVVLGGLDLSAITADSDYCVVTNVVINNSGVIEGINDPTDSGVEVQVNNFGGIVLTGTFFLTAGQIGDENITITGYDSANGIGSISPPFFRGLYFFTLAAQVNVPPDPNDGFYLAVTGVCAQTLFTSLTINGQTFLSAAAAFTPGAISFWYWASFPISAAGDYVVTII